MEFGKKVGKTPSKTGADSSTQDCLAEMSDTSLHSEGSKKLAVMALSEAPKRNMPLRDAFQNSDHASTVFQKVDKDNSGTIDIKEFRDFYSIMHDEAMSSARAEVTLAGRAMKAAREKRRWLIIFGIVVAIFSILTALNTAAMFVIVSGEIKTTTDDEKLVDKTSGKTLQVALETSDSVQIGRAHV